MPSHRQIRVFLSFAHKDEDHHRRLAEHLDQLVKDGNLDFWDDREIQPGQVWDEEIVRRLKAADLILLLVSEDFLASQYVRETEIPLTLELAAEGKATVVPVILEPCDWQSHQLAKWQALPQPPTPISQWPSRDVAYAEVARGIRALADSLKAEVAEQHLALRQKRWRTVYGQYPFRILGERYDPFHAFEQVFRRVENNEYRALRPLPLVVPLGDRVEFAGQTYQSILATLRDSDAHTGLPYDLVAMPYTLMGHCVERGLIQPLDERLNAYEDDFAWWPEMGTWEGRLYGVPLSALTMILAVREDLFEAHGLPVPDRWEDYLAIIDQVGVHPIVDQVSHRPVAPDLLQGRRHVAMWYDWVNHLHAHEANDRELYGPSSLPAAKAANTLRRGTLGYLTVARKLARYTDGWDLPHWATANWDEGIEAFSEGKLLMHFLFNDALETLRRRMETTYGGSGSRVRYLPVPKAVGLETRHGQVEGWMLCVPRGARYWQAANDVLDWFLDVEVQRAYARWGGASAHLKVIAERAQADDDGGAGRAYWESIKDSVEARATVDLVKHKGPRVVPVVERIVADLYDAVLSVGCGRQSESEATDELIHGVEQRLLRGPA